MALAVGVLWIDLTFEPTDIAVALGMCGPHKQGQHLVEIPIADFHGLLWMLLDVDTSVSTHPGCWCGAGCPPKTRATFAERPQHTRPRTRLNSRERVIPVCNAAGVPGYSRADPTTPERSFWPESHCANLTPRLRPAPHATGCSSKPTRAGKTAQPAL